MREANLGGKGETAAKECICSRASAGHPCRSILPEIKVKARLFAVKAPAYLLDRDHSGQEHTTCSAFINGTS